MSTPAAKARPRTAGRLPQLTASSVSRNAADVDLVGAYQDAGKKTLPVRGEYAALAERLTQDQVFSGKNGSVQFVRYPGGGSAGSVAFIGLGPVSEANPEKLRLAAGFAWARLKAEKARSVMVQVDSMVGAAGLRVEPLRLVRAFAEGLVLAAYQFDKYKRASQKEKPETAYPGPARIEFVSQDKSLVARLKAELPLAIAAAESVHLARDWSNEPSNVGTPEYFAAEARRLGRQYGLLVTVLNERDAARERMGLFLGVSQGAEREARIVVMEYRPRGVKNPKTLALVGKGVTFDSGGISLKPGANMENMKHDMSGASTVMGALLLAARWKVPNRVIGIMAFTENMPDGKAMQPGNILTSRSGKTVEIINTDAEGRLVLADVLDYAQDKGPDAVIDVATLTGAVSIALGKICCGVMGNDDALIEALRRAAEVQGEKAWQLPLFDEYLEDMRSEHADLRNSANDTHGGTIRGAIFLKQFIRKGTAWAHMDIASTASHVPHLSYTPKRGASGMWVRTLAQLAADF